MQKTSSSREHQVSTSLDRVLHLSVNVNFWGESFRLREKKSVYFGAKEEVREIRTRVVNEIIRFYTISALGF
ncbi:MAG: hypothetical protein KIS30_08505 [Thermoplasmata archaeon]|nr:hypothetical protein [Candidatus Sysuiplasma acidicola]MBX8646780.1 hypothetical protein [Candidatus Sysuiplasma acidicola]MDH2905674.1 hypothetical protein [Methanomassiliicoccales archaeon]